MDVPTPTLPPRNPKFWEEISMAVAWVKFPPNLTSVPESVKPFDAVVDSPVPVESALQNTLPDESVVNFPPLDSPEQF